MEVRLQIDPAIETALRELAQRHQLSLEQAGLQALAAGLSTLRTTDEPGLLAPLGAPSPRQLTSALIPRSLIPGGLLMSAEPIDLTQIEVLGTLNPPRVGPDGTIGMRSPIFAPGPVAPKTIIPLDHPVDQATSDAD